MFGAIDRIVKIFANRFEPAGQDFLYRKKLSDAPVRVTAAERDGFVADYRRTASRAYWILIAGTFVAFLVPIFLITRIPSLGAPYLMFALIAVALVIYMTIIVQAGNAPSIALRTRSTIGEGKSREEARAIMLSRMPWRNLGISALAIAYGLFRLSAHMDLTAGWNWLWLVGAAIYYAFLAYRVYQKLRYGSAEIPSSAGTWPR